MSDATQSDGCADQAVEISIHAPHERCDDSGNNMSTYNKRFQSTHRMSDATHRHHPEPYPLPISIHAPHERCDRSNANTAEEKVISIHAPHERCDFVDVKFFFPFAFQSTHRMSDATIIRAGSNGCICISIHAPHERCDSDSIERF